MALLERCLQGANIFLRHGPQGLLQRITEEGDKLPEVHFISCQDVAVEASMIGESDPRPILAQDA